MTTATTKARKVAVRGETDKTGAGTTPLVALGAERLAAILHELAEADPVINRRLKLELASLAGTEKVAAKVRKRLATIGRSCSQVEWDKVRSLAKDLSDQRNAIKTHIAPKEPNEALELLWAFLALAESVYARADDSNGTLGEVFHDALEDLARVAQLARPDPDRLVETVYTRVIANDYGQYDRLIPRLAKPLGRDGLLALRKRFEALAANPPAALKKGKRRVVGLSMNGLIFEDEIARSQHRRLVQQSLAEIADALGDVDGFIARFSVEEQNTPAIAVGIAQRLLEAGRAEDALPALLRAEAKGKRSRFWPEWDQAHIRVLQALGRVDDAQNERLARFYALLDAEALKAYLKGLPDFDNDEAEERALAHAASFADFHLGLHFLVQWPAPEAAARMVLARHAEIDGNHYEVLAAAAEKLETKHPLAATLVLRAMIHFALLKKRIKRYPHAARHLVTCESIAPRIPAFAPHPDHATYTARLRAEYGRVSRFWTA